MINTMEDYESALEHLDELRDELKNLAYEIDPEGVSGVYDFENFDDSSSHPKYDEFLSVHDEYLEVNSQIVDFMDAHPELFD